MKKSSSFIENSLALVLAGGSGQRLWPQSRKKFPKQFIPLLPSSKSLLRQTLQHCQDFPSIYLSSSQDLKELVLAQVENCPFKERLHCLYEPFTRNTAPAIAFACLKALQENKGHHVMVSLPADHFIFPEEVFRENLKRICEIARKGSIVLMGVEPRFPATGYGYIQVPLSASPSLQKEALNANTKTKSAKGIPNMKGAENAENGKGAEALPILQFHEKPSPEKATFYLKKGNYFWNAGIMAFQVNTMVKLLEAYASPLWKKMEAFTENPLQNQHLYRELVSISIEHTLLEKIDKTYLQCFPTQFYWSDIGSWDSISEVESKIESKTKIEVETESKAPIEKEREKEKGKGKESQEKIHRGGTFTQNAKNNFVWSQDNQKTYAFIAVEDLIVVDQQDALLIVKKGHSQKVKDLVNKIEQQTPNTQVLSEHGFSLRPWGEFHILKESSSYKSKIICVKPKSQLSYQSHEQREEHWIVVEGIGEVVLNGKVLPVSYGSYIHIPQKAKHRIRNTGDTMLKFIEVQVGTYFGEDDIVRYEDDYKRENL